MIQHSGISRQRLALIGWCCALLVVCVTAGYWLTDPQIVGGRLPEVAEMEPVGGKMTHEERLEWLKEKNRHREFNREHPGLMGQAFGAIYGTTLGPMLSVLGLVNMAPLVIKGIALLAAIWIVVKIFRTLRPAR